MADQEQDARTQHDQWQDQRQQDQQVQSEAPRLSQMRDERIVGWGVKTGPDDFGSGEGNTDNG